MVGHYNVHPRLLSNRCQDVDQAQFGHWGLGFFSLNARAGTKDWHDAWFLGGWLIEAHLGLNDDGRGTITPRLPPPCPMCACMGPRVSARR